MDVRARERHWSLIPPDVARRLRARVIRVGDALLTVCPGSDALRMNRVIGLGYRGAAREAMIDEIIALYRASKVLRFSLQVGPGPQRNRIEAWLVARGFKRSEGDSMLVRDCRIPVPRVHSGVRVLRARAVDAGAVVGILERCFAMPASRRAWSLAAVRSPGHEYYVARAGRIPVATGILGIDGNLAWLGAGATLTRWRGRGAHGAVIAARLRGAARAGCLWAWVETAPPVAGRPGGSRRNLLRLGFVAACEKSVFVWGGRSG